MKMSVFSDLKIFPVNSNGSKLIARGSVVVSNTVRVNFSVLNGSKGRFVAMPSEKSNKTDEQGNTKYFPVVQLSSRELSDELNRLVLAELDGGSKSGEKSTSGSARKPASKSGDGIPF
jgi:DNA-binding cell septation regulator SpoVG